MEATTQATGDATGEAVESIPRLEKRGAFREFIETRAAAHGVTPYAFLLHVLSLCKWSAKGVVKVIGGTPALVYATMHHYNVSITAGHGGAMGALATQHGCHDVVEFGVQMIRKYGNHVRAARAMHITPIQVDARFIVRGGSFNAVEWLLFCGDVALYGVRGACLRYGLSYQYMQQSYYAAREEGLEFANFTAYAAMRFKRMGRSAKVQSVLGWQRAIADELIQQGADNVRESLATAAVLRSVNKSKWKRSAAT